MINVEEIKKKTDNIFFDVLRAAIKKEIIFPKSIRSNKSVSQDFELMGKELGPIIENSKDRKGYGYSIVYSKINTRKHGQQDIPVEIKFETLEDYLLFAKKKTPYNNFLSDVSLIISQFSELEDLFVKSPNIVLENHEKWPELLSVCYWFKHLYEQDKYYIRELPIESIHTKFIENNKGTLKILLDVIIPDKIRTEESDFEKRYGLKYSPLFIRLRILDKHLFINNCFTDVCLTVGEFKQTPLNCKNILITENLMNFLTLPLIDNTIALWGGGFGIDKLKNISWFENKNIYYWGDLDTHGMQILSQLRIYYPHVFNLMMDKETLELHRQYWGVGKETKVLNLPGLTDQEKELFFLLKEHNTRLEQERIPQTFVLNILGKTFNIN